jgi:hypothetical protein
MHSHTFGVIETDAAARAVDEDARSGEVEDGLRSHGCLCKS